MRFRDTLIICLSLIITAGMLITAGNQLDYINGQREKMNLIVNEAPKNAPPSLAFATVAMGAFRGLVVDVLWMRADKLKDEGQFFDAKQLAEWITILQPRMDVVWEFQAWNMAYNISVAIPESEPDQRWHWIKNGYELLRDQGIPLNPRSILLYRELARIFQHKIGAVSDDAHKYYKLQLAESMGPLVSPGTEEFYAELKTTPTQWQAIEQDTSMADLLSELRGADSRFTRDKEFVQSYLSLRQNPKRFNDAAFEVINKFRGTKALHKLDMFAKAYELRNTWKFEPALMEEINKKYGPVEWDDPNHHLPLDWRHPDVHAIYWATKGLQVASKEEWSAAEANTDRIVSHSLQNLFRNGKIYIRKDIQDGTAFEVINGSEVFLRPDLRMFDTYNTVVKTILGKYKDVTGTSQGMQNGHRNMLINALFSFYQSGNHKQAQKIFDELKELYPREEYKVPLVSFVRARLKEELQSLSIHDASEVIIMMLRESYFLYGLREDDESYGREQIAKEIYDHYQTTYSDENRIDLPEFKLLRYLALIDFLNDEQYSKDLRLALSERIKIERPDLAKQLEQQEKEMIQKLDKEVDNSKDKG